MEDCCNRPSNRKTLVQCELRSDCGLTTIAYIDSCDAVVGTSGRFLDAATDRRWTVVNVFQAGTPVDYRKAIRQHRKRTGDALPTSAPSASREPG